MEKDELRTIMREFCELPLTFLEIKDEQTHIKMKKPAQENTEDIHGVGSNDFAAGAAAAAKVAATALSAVAPTKQSIADAAAAIKGGSDDAGAIEAAGATAGATGSAGAGTSTDTPNTADPSTADLAQQQNIIKVSAPIVGIYYASPSPNEAPYVELNSHINEGDVLCLIEAMKMINEIKSPVSGTVRQINCESGCAVGYDDLLMLIEADE